ncbi:MAG: anthrone oxygenase family protein, partial [Thermoanaerobaculia bacterium]
MTPLAAARFAAVLFSGLVAGIFLGDRMGATFARPALSPSSFVTFQQIQHVHFLTMMPILIGAAVVSLAAWLLLIRSRLGSAELLFLALAAAACAAVIVVTRTVNVPINDRLMTWNPASPPADVREIWARWEQTHTVRTVLAAAAFLLE